MPTPRALNTRHGVSVGTKSVIGTDGILVDVGDLSSLTTTSKTSIVSAVNEVKGNFTGITTADVAENSGFLYFTTARARESISVTDTGGDGSLSYDTLTGVLTYTGPSAAEVRAHFSGGTGVTITSGVVAIGQPVGTTDNVTFNDTTLTGVLYGPANFVIDPAEPGDNTGKVIILGDLEVKGVTTTIDSVTVAIGDKNLLLAKDATSSAQADGGGITLAGANASFNYSSVTDSWNPNKTVKGIAGEAVSPTYSFSADPDTGLYSSGANSISIATGGVERVRVISGGNTTLFGGNLIFDRAGFATTLGLIAPTANRALNLPDVDGTLATTADLSQFAPTTSAQLAGVISDETGTGLLVFATSPTLTTPVLGAATATSINKVAITAPATSATLTIADGKTLTVSNTLTFTGTDTSSIAFGTGGTVAYTASNNPFTGANTFTNSTGQIFRQAATQDGVLLRGRAGGTSSFTVEIVPSTLSASRTVTLADGNTTLQAGTMAVTGGTLAQFATTTSLQLAGVISDETGTGSLVFATSPSLTTPVLGVASVTSINKVSITAPATGATLTIADGKTLTVSNTLTFTGTDTSSVSFGTGGTVAYTSNKLSVFAATTSAELAGVISDETGSGALVFATSPTLSGTPLSTTAAVDTNTTQIATTAFVVGQASATNPLGLGTVAIGTSLRYARQDHVHPTTGLGLTSGTLGQFAATTSAQLAGVISDETGTGALVFATSPTLTTPVLGVATGTSFNGITGLSSTNPAALGAVAVGTGTTTARADHVHPTTGLGLTSGTLAQFAATTSSQLAGVISDETGTGALVFATSPTLTTPAIGAATGTSLSLTGGGLTTRPATNQDAMVVSGRAGGTGNFAVTLTPTTLTASRTLTAPDVSGTIVTTGDTGTVTSAMIADGTIVNGDINASAAIADTKLDTISTAGKVSNSATTATDANTPSAIVARDASGDFTAGTITADLTGNADTATVLETPRTIGGVSFDGGANIDLPGVNIAGDQDTTGNAATATKLDSSRTFAVTGDVTGTVSSDLTSGASIATSIASGVIVDADVNANAEIAVSKLADGSARQLLQTDAAGTGVEWTSDVSVPGRLIVNGTDITESARDIEESRLIRKFGTMSIGQPGTVPFGVGPVIPPGMSLVGIGPDAYNVIDVYSGSVC